MSKPARLHSEVGATYGSQSMTELRVRVALRLAYQSLRYEWSHFERTRNLRSVGASRGEGLYLDELAHLAGDHSENHEPTFAAVESVSNQLRGAAEVAMPNGVSEFEDGVNAGGGDTLLYRFSIDGLVGTDEGLKLMERIVEAAQVGTNEIRDEARRIIV